MKVSQEADFNLTHSILNYLNAQYRAHYAFVNALLQLSSPDVTQAIIQKTQKNLAAVIKWNQDLYAGMPIFSSEWRYPETFDAQQAFDLLNEMRSDITKIGEILKSIEEEKDSANKSENLKFLIAINLRYVYGRENHIKGYIEYAKSRDNRELLDAYTAELPYASAEIKKATADLKEVKTFGAISEEAFQDLFTTLPAMRGLFRSYLNDINIYLAVYQPKYTFELAGISEKEADDWRNVNFSAQEAGYWKAYNFKAADAAEWYSYNITEPSAAFVWRHNNFTPEDALAWISLGVLPKFALELLAQGQTPALVHQRLEKIAQKKVA
jgi:hypothetical protein